MMIVGQQTAQIRARDPLQDAVRDDSGGKFMMAAAGKIGFAEVITGSQNGEMFDRFVAQDLVGLATAAENAVNVFAGVSFLKQERAFAIGLDR